jgi:four helix bundle protein
MGKCSYENLQVWQLGKDLAVQIYRLTGQGLFEKDYSLRDQIRRSAISIPSNIAEGNERGSDKESIRFFSIALGSLAELRTQLCIAYEIGYIKESIYKEFDSQYRLLSKKIAKLIQARRADA